MLVGLLTVHIHMAGLGSIKDKRRIVKSLTGRLKSRFNISVAEVDKNDIRSTAVIGIAMVSNEKKYIDKKLDSILNFLRVDGRFTLGQIDREVFS